MPNKIKPLAKLSNLGIIWLKITLIFPISFLRDNPGEGFLFLSHLCKPADFLEKISRGYKDKSADQPNVVPLIVEELSQRRFYG